MNPRKRSNSQDFITLEGMDYNLLRAAEALAREEFARPENAEKRRRHVKALFPITGEITVELVHPEAPVSSELL